jgi:hypothetical protein
MCKDNTCQLSTGRNYTILGYVSCPRDEMIKLGRETDGV